MGATMKTIHKATHVLKNLNLFLHIPFSFLLATRDVNKCQHCISIRWAPYLSQKSFPPFFAQGPRNLEVETSGCRIVSSGTRGNTSDNWYLFKSKAYWKRYWNAEVDKTIGRIIRLIFLKKEIPFRSLPNDMVAGVESITNWAWHSKSSVPQWNMSSAIQSSVVHFISQNYREPME